MARKRSSARPSGPPDLVIADLVMPGIDGLELLTRLKRDFPTPRWSFLTGQGSIETAVQAIKDGAYDYLTKPVDPTRLQLLLDRALERSETCARSSSCGASSGSAGPSGVSSAAPAADGSHAAGGGVRAH